MTEDQMKTLVPAACFKTYCQREAGMSASEIAKKNKCTVSAVHVHLKQCRDVLETPWEPMPVLNIENTRAKNCLEVAGITSFDLLAFTINHDPIELHKMPNLGKKTFEYLQDFVKQWQR